MAMDSGLAEHATVIDAAPQLVGGSSFLEVDSPAALGGVCVATTPVSSMNWSRQLHRGDSEDAVALSATRAFLDECEVDSEEEGYQVRGYCWSSSPDTVASARSGADGGTQQFHVPIVRVPSDNAAVFAVLLDDVEQVYTSLEALNMSEKSGDDVPSNAHPQDEQGEMFYEPCVVIGAPFVKHRRVATVLFSMHMAQKAVWLSISTTSRRINPSFFRNVSDHANDVAS
jgi:hypothetical protein